VKWQDEDYGVLWSRRLWLERVRFEVEIGFVRPSWAELNPLDPGTRRVVADGCRILYDPDRLLGACVPQWSGGRNAAQSEARYDEWGNALHDLRRFGPFGR
jgi:hypothetical protein